VSLVVTRAENGRIMPSETNTFGSKWNSAPNS
jgi:hypothetical protein